MMAPDSFSDERQPPTYRVLRRMAPLHCRRCAETKAEYQCVSCGISLCKQCAKEPCPRCQDADYDKIEGE